jgi:hypothetical protein
VRDNPLAVTGSPSSVRVVEELAAAVRGRGGRGACDWTFWGQRSAADCARQQTQPSEDASSCASAVGERVEQKDLGVQGEGSSPVERMKSAMTAAGESCAQLDIAPAAVGGDARGFNGALTSKCVAVLHHAMIASGAGAAAACEHRVQTLTVAVRCATCAARQRRRERPVCSSCACSLQGEETSCADCRWCVALQVSRVTSGVCRVTCDV